MKESKGNLKDMKGKVKEISRTIGKRNIEGIKWKIKRST